MLFVEVYSGSGGPESDSVRLARQALDEDLFEVVSTIQHGDDADAMVAEVKNNPIRSDDQFPVLHVSDSLQLGHDTAAARE